MFEEALSDREETLRYERKIADRELATLREQLAASLASAAAHQAARDADQKAIQELRSELGALNSLNRQLEVQVREGTEHYGVRQPLSQHALEAQGREREVQASLSPPRQFAPMSQAKLEKELLSTQALSPACLLLSP